MWKMFFYQERFKRYFEFYRIRSAPHNAAILLFPVVMMSLDLPTLASPAALLSVALLLLPLALVVLGLRATVRPPWRAIQGLAGTAWILAACMLGLGAQPGPNAVGVAPGWPAVSITPLGASVLAMTALLLWVLTRYVRRYLAGDPRQGRFVAWQCATIAAVWGVILLDNLLWVAMAWCAVSLCVQPLVGWFGERDGAGHAVRNKFWWDRLADALVAVGTLALWHAYGTTSLSALAALATREGPSLASHAGLVCFSLAALIRAAQLPAHRWLVRVMEAPTPVSALLHAGVINLGGLVLLRLAPALDSALLAQWLLVLGGSVAVAVGASTMLQQNSAKAGLVWSSIAQLGLMLLALGLGAYPLVLLHLLAHSLYKAHAFLAAGTLPLAQRHVRASGGARPLAEQLGIVAVSALALLVTAHAVGLDPRAQPAWWVLGTLVLASLTDLARRLPGTLPAALLSAGLGAVGLTLLYGLWHAGLAQVVSARATQPDIGMLLAAGAAIGYLLLRQHRLPLPIFTPQTLSRHVS